ncbi:hypothetical protein N7486_004388 [Penicillium sp. IBT 16267x]|nr:hypothetical protein N7486_004388 [Penicillium sp. IBT 16267x]
MGLFHHHHDQPHGGPGGPQGGPQGGPGGPGGHEGGSHGGPAALAVTGVPVILVAMRVVPTEALEVPVVSAVPNAALEAPVVVTEDLAVTYVFLLIS